MASMGTLEVTVSAEFLREIERFRADCYEQVRLAEERAMKIVDERQAKCTCGAFDG